MDVLDIIASMMTIDELHKPFVGQHFFLAAMRQQRCRINDACNPKIAIWEEHAPSSMIAPP
jgi:hypothetical protein